jgi:phenylalanyl-tRNA synthetase alpha chain
MTEEITYTTDQLMGVLIDIQQRTKKELESSTEDKGLLTLKYLGNKSEFATASKYIQYIPKEDRGRIGSLINQVKQAISDAIEQAQVISISATPLTDVTIPGHKPYVGHLHPTTIVINEMNAIFTRMGFSVYDGPEIENDEYNYDRLNLPQDHPARDLQDTLFIQAPDILLRTHTSSMESHILEEFAPPFRFVIPGKVYRYENANASNNVMFYQYEGIAVSKDITVAELKSTLDTFIKQFFGETRESRFRCKYYPQVEPGVGVDISCAFCNKKGCTVCKGRGWIEMLGAGMVHPNMLRRVNLDPSVYSGFAWGMGLDRIVMQRFGINDIRSLYNGDIGYKE